MINLIISVKINDPNHKATHKFKDGVDRKKEAERVCAQGSVLRQSSFVKNKFLTKVGANLFPLEHVEYP